MISPLVSVIMASYNHAPYVAEALQSVLDQTYKDIEVLVVDDGSTDETPKVISGFTDPRIKFTSFLENRKIHARNFALKQAKGTYVAFQNSDDVWQKEKIESQIHYLEQNQQAVACFTEIELIDKTGHSYHRNFFEQLFRLNSAPVNYFSTVNRTRHKWLRHFFDIGNCLCISSSIVRRSALEQAGNFSENLTQLSDLDLWVRLAGIGELHIINKPLTMVRIGSSNTTSAGPERSNNEYAQILENYTKPPLVDQLKFIFNDILPTERQRPHELLKWLQEYSFTLGKPHWLFAEKLSKKAK